VTARTKRQRQARALRRRAERAEARVVVLEAAQRKRKKPAGRRDDSSSSVASTSLNASTASPSGATEEAPEGARVAGSGDPATPYSVELVEETTNRGGECGDLADSLAEQNLGVDGRLLALLDGAGPLHDVTQSAVNEGAAGGRDGHETSSRFGDEVESSPSDSTVGEPSDGTGEVTSPDPVPSDLGPLALVREYRREIFGAVWPPLLVLLIFAIPLVVGILVGGWAS